MTIRLILAGEPSLVRDGVHSLLSAVDDFELVGEAASLAEAVGALRQLRPDVLVLDAGTDLDDDGLAGPDAASELARVAQVSGTQVVVLADRLDSAAVLHAARSGVAGYLLRGDGTGSLVAAIRCTASGDAWLCPPAARQLLDQFRSPQAPASTLPAQRSARTETLSEREIAVLRLLALGRSNAEIAEELLLARSTVKTHVSRILAKLELRDRVQLAAFAHQNDLT